ncbi:MAG: UbiA family prenyltransferase [Fidelibacterota bacterium]
MARFITLDSQLYRSIGAQMKRLDSLFLLRPTLFFPVWIMIMAGVSAAEGIDNPEIYWNTYFNWPMILLFAGLTLVAGSTFIRNQLMDVDTDSVNEKLFLLEKGAISTSAAERLAKVCLIAGMIFVVSGSFIELAQTGKLSSILVVVWTLLVYQMWGVFYSTRQFNWARTPILGNLANGLAGLALFMAGWNFVSSETLTGLLFSIPYLLAFASVSLLTAIPDIPGDVAADKTTFPARFGIPVTITVGTILASTSAIIGYLLNDPVISTSSIVSVPFFLVALIFLKEHHILRAIRYPIFILAMFLSVRYPWFFVTVLFTFFLARYYYYFRFGIIYPTFQVIHDSDQA